MLTMGILLAVISVALEMFLVTKNPGIRHWMTTHDTVGMIMSFVLSVALGTIFGAEGLISLFGGIMSTVITTVIYKTHALDLVDNYQAHRTEIVSQARSVWDVTVKSVILIWKIFTAPVRFLIWCKVQVDKMIAGYHKVRSYLPQRRAA